MKKIIRMFVFSAIALFLTSLFDSGISFQGTIISFIEAVVLISLAYYIIVPISKVILLPFNILSLGLASTIVYFVLFYIISSRFGLFTISDWTFQGLQIGGFSIPSTHINSFFNTIVAAVSVSTIINILEKLL